jgi:16S rRNA (guanine527-N7)-methyltransferase
MQDSEFETYAKLSVSRESFERLQILAKLLLDWQKHINLISPATIPELWKRHILDSAQLLPLIPEGAKTIADLGSGAGFPGLVLAATQPATVHMFEANGKKAAFLSEALRQMKCGGVVHRDRLEPLYASPNTPSVEVVTARAFAPLPLLLSLAAPFMRETTTALFHKGQDVDTELTEAAKSWKMIYKKHPSATDSLSVILEVKELARVQS